MGLHVIYNGIWTQYSSGISEFNNFKTKVLATVTFAFTKAKCSLFISTF